MIIADRDHVKRLLYSPGMVTRPKSETGQPKSAQVGVRFSPREDRRLTAYCEVRGLNRSEAIRSAVNLLLDTARIEDPGPVAPDEPPVAKTVAALLREAMNEAKGQ
jgi:hypothetical protein